MGVFQVFENWKREHNHLLKEKYRKVRKNEIEQKFQQQEKEEGRKSISKSAFSEWSVAFLYLIFIKLSQDKQVIFVLYVSIYDMKLFPIIPLFLRCEKKKNDLLEEAAAKHKELKDNAETERYMKEERDKMALDMYESWLVGRVTPWSCSLCFKSFSFH